MRRSGTVAAALALVFFGLPAAAGPASGDAERVTIAARACLARFDVHDVRALLGCLNPASVAVLARRYVEARLEPAARGVPDALVSAVGGSPDRAWFLALPPAELLALAVRGALIDLEARGHRVQGARLDLLRVRHRIDELYDLEIRLDAQVTHGLDVRAVRDTRTVLARVIDGAVLIDLPGVVERLLSLE